MRSLAAVLIAFICGAGAGFLFGFRFAQVPKPTVDLSIQDGGIYRVRKVVDGDTIVLENGVHVRYLGVNAPETGHFVKDAAPMGREATLRNVALVEGKQVSLQLAHEPLDMYGRILSRVIIINPESPENGTDAGKTMVKEGLARPMGLGIPREEFEQLKQLEENARAAKIGIWSLEDKAKKSDGDGKPYCASSSKPTGVYHLLMCPMAQRIKAQNLQRYASIEEAEVAGRTPCSTCIPK